MRVEAQPDNTLEKNASPETQELLAAMMETVHGPLLSRATQWAIWHGLFEALAQGPLTAEEVAARCQTGPRSTAAVLAALATTPSLDLRDGKFTLTDAGRVGLLGAREGAFACFHLMGIVEWSWYDHLADYLKSGETFDFHARLSPIEWRIYEDSQYVRSKSAGTTLVDPLPMPKGPCKVLDLAGGHGLVGIELCRKHPQLQAVVLDLPGAIDSMTDRFEQEAKGLEGRISRIAGDALEMELGENEYDVIVSVALLHVLSEAKDREIVKRCARALKPGGVYMPIETMHRSKPSPEQGQMRMFYGLLLAFTCASGGWATEQINQWQRDAGLEPIGNIGIVNSGGAGAIMARKPERPAGR